MDGIDFRGKRVLDIGCWDGLWSFEAERRGAAEVYATDYLAQRHSRDQPTFALAHRELESRVKYLQDVSVYDVEKLGITDFDIVIFCGIYYHLRDPLLALARLRRVMREGATILVEGDAIYGRRASYARFHYHNPHKQDPSNWWVPTIPCLRQWLESTYFGDLLEYRTRLVDHRTPLQMLRRMAAQAVGWPIATRVSLTARAQVRTDPKYLYPDDDLRAFDLNAYRW
jgi:tRNA (mo5U34)-methyltransferase